MILIGQDIVDEGIVTDTIDGEVQTQMCGMDLTIGEIEEFSGFDSGIIDFDNTARRLPNTTKIPLRNGEWRLNRGSYIVRFNEIVTVPSGCMGHVFPRSTLIRCGTLMSSSVYDPGYSGKSVVLIYVDHSIIFKQNARLAQIVFHTLIRPAEKLYSGVYQGEGIKT